MSRGVILSGSVFSTSLIVWALAQSEAAANMNIDNTFFMITSKFSAKISNFPYTRACISIFYTYVLAFALSANAQIQERNADGGVDYEIGDVTRTTDDGDLTPEYLAKIDSLMQVYEEEKMVRDLIKKIEYQQIDEEKTFDIRSVTPLLQGSVHLITQRGYIRQQAQFATHNMDAASYSAALAPLAINWALKAAGVKSRSSARRMATANLMTYALVEGLSLGTKYSVSEIRPDRTDCHSMPSVKSALAFASATILSREYGHLSPWVSIGSYVAAAGTQFLDIRSNRHWLHDSFIGAGIGMLSANIGYFLSDRIFGDGDINTFELRKRDLFRLNKMYNCPSAISFVSGSEFGNRMIDIADHRVKLGSCLSAGVEASWFINPNFSLEAIALMSDSQAKVMTAGGAAGATTGEDDYFTGDNFSIYHFDVGAKLSAPLMLPDRAGVRILAGVRTTSGMTFMRDATELQLDSQTRFELGCGFSYDALDAHNYSLGFSFDYRHAFASFMKNRYSFYTVYRILF